MPTARCHRNTKHAVRAILLCVAVALAGCELEVKKPWPDGVDPCSPNPCAKSGACENWTGTCAIADGGAGFTCTDWQADGTPPNGPDGKPLTRPDKFEATEVSCDGVDNDCDGQTDEALVGNPLTDCGGKGICVGATVHIGCQGGAWRCDFSILPGWEASETTCDGVDNDCDGQTDETVSPGPHDCRREGVCAALAPATCEGGKWNCGYEDAPDYEKAETKCDGKDNDCDGKIDSGLAPKSLADGKSCDAKGVCADGVTIACSGGQPVCSYAAIASWQALETVCDGKDNDCDGTTDNLQGTNEPLADSKIDGCLQQGVCKINKTSIVRACSNGKWACSYAKVPLYEAKESLCDGRDNDCDGTVDIGLPAPKSSPCQKDGVCAAGKAICGGGLWQCDFAALAKLGYEPFEITCDGKDNDCDGKTDVDPTPAAHNCATKGVCAAGVAVTCTKGVPTCNYDAVPLYEAGSETSCDGKDNDCDGVTDEAGLDASKAGCGAGVCAGKAKAICAAGAWQCDVSKVTGYEAKELSCDGVDNDCDGKTDELDDLDLSGTSCGLSLGVCGTDGKKLCTAGKVSCNYGSAYEKKETLCDGKDNDCNGQTDLGLCKVGKSCGADSWCDAGSCAAVHGGSGKQCTAKFGQCAAVGSQGNGASADVSFSDNGAGLCASNKSVVTCNSGKWSAAKACPAKTPACSKGKCLLCVPGEKTCDPNVPSDVVQCDVTGAKTTKLKTCAAGKCVGAGLCVVKGVIAISDTTKGITATAAAAITGGGFAAAWVSKEPYGNTVYVRVFDAEGKPHIAAKTGFAVGDDKSYATAGSNIAAVGSQVGGDNSYAITWTSGDKAWLAVYDGKTHKLAARLSVQGPGTADAQGVAIAALGTGFVHVWSAAVSGSSGFRVHGQRVGTDGKAIGVLFEIKNDKSGQANKEPAIAVAPNGGFTVAWVARSTLGGSPEIVGRKFAKDGKPVGASVVLVTGASLATPTVAYLGATLVGAWAISAGSGDVQLATWDAALKSVKAAANAHTITAGKQALPQLVADAGGKLLLVFETAALATGSSLDVAVRKVDGDALFEGKETLGGGDGKALQDLPAAIGFADGRELILWRHRATASTVGKIQAQFR